jgi:cell migration-inducing and hyaluronan-binding protein
MLNDGVNDSVVTDDTCVIHPTWNASVCKGDVGRLNLSDSRGELPAGVNLESRTARFALLSSLGPDAPDTPLAKAQRAALFSRRPPQAPITLVRNGKEFKTFGDESTVRAGTEIEVKTERTKVTLSLAEMNLGSWVKFKYPGFASAASGKAQDSLNALRKASQTSYFRDGNDLWVKLVVAKAPLPIVRPTDLQASITVSRAQAVAAGTATGAGANTVGKS